MPTRTDPIHALREGWDLPETLDELKRPLLGAIEEIARGLADSYSETQTHNATQRLLPDSWQTLAIMGERGSGKSTLLAAVSSELEREGRHLVMQTMRPEHFGDTDSVITTFLADLGEMLTIEAEEANEQGGSSDGESASYQAFDLLDDTERDYAMSRTTSAALEHGTDSPTDYAEDVLSVSRSGVRLARQLLALARELCYRPDHPEGSRLIVVPIDDPDLSHHSLVDILSDLQILGSVPGIVPLTCFSPSDLNGTWAAARRKMVPDIPDDRLNFLLHRHLEKLFPYRCRFEIEPIAPSHRAAFAPIGRSDSLQSKLATLRASVESVSEAIWPFDEAVTNSKERLGLASPLPNNARTLVQLWESLDALEPEPDATMLHLALRRVLDILTESVAVRLKVSTSDLIEIGPAVPDAPYKRPMKTKLDQVRFFVSSVDNVSNDAEAGQPSIGSINLRRLHRVRAATPSSDSPEIKDSDYLDGDVVAAMLALQEIEYGSGLFEAGGTRLFVGSGEWLFLQVVQIANQATDNTFLLLPEATTLSEVQRSAELWNRLVDLCEGLGVEETLATGIEAARLTVDREGALEPAHDYAKTFDRACATYELCVDREDNTAAAFVRWFEVDLPLQWHSAFLSSDRIRSLASRHKELRENASKTRTSADTFEASLFEKRLKALLDAVDEQGPEGVTQLTWLAGYFEFARSVDSQQLDRLSRLYPAWQRDSAGVRAGAATFGSVTKAGANVGVSPFPTSAGTELLAAGRAALRRARAAARAATRTP